MFSSSYKTTDTKPKKIILIRSLKGWEQNEVKETTSQSNQEPRTGFSKVSVVSNTCGPEVMDLIYCFKSWDCVYLQQKDSAEHLAISA